MSKLKTYNKYDPTRTVTLRKAFVSDMNKRFRAFRGIIRKAIINDDCFALTQNPLSVLANNYGLSSPGRRAFDFSRTSDKIDHFMYWLNKQENIFLETEGRAGIRTVTGPQLGEGIEQAWTNKYIDSGYKQGALRARQELRKIDYNIPTVEETGGIEVLFNQPVHADRVGVLYTRTFNDLKGITNAMDSQISRVLAQGMADGEGPRELAKLLTRTISGPSGDLGITDTLGRYIPAERRAQILARTEIIRAHHVAMVQEYENWQVEGVYVKAEWSTAGDERVCQECADLEGKVFTLNEIRNLIPRHPGCRCISLPYDVKTHSENI